MAAHALNEPIMAGERVLFVGHSFHMFVIRPLITLAKEAGIKGHWAQGWDMIGGSTPTQHWERNGDDNEPRKILASGDVDVLTLATNVRTADPAVDSFAELAVTHNPNVRVMLQHSWGDHLTGAIMRARHGLAAEGAPIPTTEEERSAWIASIGANTDRDQATAADLAAMREEGRNAQAWRDQLAGINARHGRTVGYLVPVNDAVLRTREAVVANELPGVTRQSELFRDVLGHAAQPLMDVVTYVWLAALYRVSPMGLRGLTNLEDPVSADQQRVLQEIAWQSVLDEPMSGLHAHR